MIFMFASEDYIHGLENALPVQSRPPEQVATFKELGRLAEAVDGRAATAADFDAEFHQLAAQAVEIRIRNPHRRASILAAAISGAPYFRITDLAAFDAYYRRKVDAGTISEEEFARQRQDFAAQLKQLGN